MDQEKKEKFIMGADKVGKGDFILYLTECPECGAKDRKPNEDALAGGALITGGSIITSAIFGGPLIGALSTLTFLEMVAAGTIPITVAGKLIKWNFELLSKLESHKIFKCRHCGSTKLVN